MDRVINIHEATTHLLKIVDEVAAGAEVIIAKAGKPMARLSPIGTPSRPKKLGLLKGKIEVPDDFNEPLADEMIASKGTDRAAAAGHVVCELFGGAHS